MAVLRDTEGTDPRRAGTAQAPAEGAQTAPAAVAAQGTSPGAKAAARGGAGVEFCSTPETLRAGLAARTADGKAARTADGGSMEGLYRSANADPRRTPAEAAKEARRRKWLAASAAIGDVVSGLANLVGATRYARPAGIGKKPSSQSLREEWERLDKEHADRIADYVRGLSAARAADRKAAADSRKADAAAKSAEARAGSDALRGLLYGRQAGYYGQLARKAGAQADNESKYGGARMRSETERNRMQGRAAMERARSGGFHTSFMGKDYSDEEAYHRDVAAAARRAGIPRYTRIVSGGTEYMPNYKYVEKDWDALAAEAESKARNSLKANN